MFSPDNTCDNCGKNLGEGVYTVTGKKEFLCDDCDDEG